MPTFSVDVMFYGTAYVKAETEEQAREMLAEHFGECPDGYKPMDEKKPLNGVDLAARDISLDDDVELSPCFTSYGFNPGEIQSDEDDEDEACLGCGAVPGTPEYGTVGDGFDGYCGSCADKREESGEVEIG
jgi:hypothetical protein